MKVIGPEGVYYQGSATGFPTSEIISAKKGHRISAGLCIECGLEKPCRCKIPKSVARRANDRAGLPTGMTRRGRNTNTVGGKKRG
jgi:hypothetical protein